MDSSNKEKKKNHSPKESYDIYLKNDQDELKTYRSRKPLTFEKNNNDITFLNSKVNEIKEINEITKIKEKKEENVNDNDDEGIIHETHGYKNIFKGVEIYQKKLGMNPYNETNIYE